MRTKRDLDLNQGHDQAELTPTSRYIKDKLFARYSVRRYDIDQTPAAVLQFFYLSATKKRSWRCADAGGYS